MVNASKIQKRKHGIRIRTRIYQHLWQKVVSKGDQTGDGRNWWFFLESFWSPSQPWLQVTGCTCGVFYLWIESSDQIWLTRKLERKKEERDHISHVLNICCYLFLSYNVGFPILMVVLHTYQELWSLKSNSL